MRRAKRCPLTSEDRAELQRLREDVAAKGHRCLKQMRRRIPGLARVHVEKFAEALRAEGIPVSGATVAECMYWIKGHFIPELLQLLERDVEGAAETAQFNASGDMSAARWAERAQKAANGGAR
jgi:hypothetical protein